MVKSLLLTFAVVCGLAGAVLAVSHPAPACEETSSNGNYHGA